MGSSVSWNAAKARRSVAQSHPKIRERLFHSLFDLPHNRNLKSEIDRNCVQEINNTLNRSKQTTTEAARLPKKINPRRLIRRPLRHRDMLAECCGLSCSLVEPLDHEVHRDSWHLLEDVTWAGSNLTTVQGPKNEHKGSIDSRLFLSSNTRHTFRVRKCLQKKTSLGQAKKFTHPSQDRS